MKTRYLPIAVLSLACAMPLGSAIAQERSDQGKQQYEAMMQSFRNARDACIEWGGGKIHEVKVNEDVSLTVRPLSPEGLTCALLEDQDSIMNDAFKNGILIGGIIGFSVGLALLGVVRFVWRSLKPNFQ